MTMIKRFLLGALVLVAFIGAVPKQPSAQESVIETIQQRGALVVGLATFVPWAMLDKDGELIGFEIDVAKKLAADMDVDVEFVPTAWDGIIPALLAGKFDVIISGMTITAQRNVTVNFSDPYAFSGMRLVAAKKHEGTLTAIEDFDSPDITFSLRRGSTPVAYARENFPKANINLFDDDGASILEVVNGNADATLGYEPNPSTWVIDYPDQAYIVSDEFLNPGAEGFALRKGDPDALNFFNNWIAANWRNGFLQDRNNYWFRSLDYTDQLPE